MRVATVAAAFSLWLVAGCSAPQSSSPLDGDALFVAVPRGDDGARRAALSTSALPAATDEGFYLAVNKKAFTDRWFLSGYIKQFFPGGVGYGAARSLGTRVVTFRVQNGKLFVFDAADGKKTSDTFDPSLIVEAYPIVSEYTTFSGWNNADRYVLIDPSAGLNEFGLLSDAFAVGSAPGKFSIDLSYLQAFRKLDDGMTFEQVFTGYSDQFNASAGAMAEPNEFRYSGTLGLSLRKYAEGAGFTPTALPAKEHYFRSPVRLNANQGSTVQNAIKWNIKPGMKPIVWLISPQIAALAADPKYAAFDILGAIEKGVETWNTVFGFQAMVAKVAAPEDSFADDDKNYLIFDADPTYGYAFANWRTNPNTGEIRGATVYFNGIWLQDLGRFQSDVLPGGLTPPPAPAALTWPALQSDPLCNLPAPRFRVSANDSGLLPGTLGSAALTGKDKAERYLTHTIAHEIGHTLGLRHNFKGSLVPPSASLMDYLLDDDSIAVPAPQHYDVEAIRFLYGLQATAPSDPFCTDDSTTVDPDCARFDQTANPLTIYYTPFYQSVVRDYLTLASTTAPNTTLNNVLQWVRSGTPAQRLAAFHTVIDPVHAAAPDPTQPPVSPAVGSRIDTVARRIVSRLYLDAASLRGQYFTADPPADLAYLAALRVELRGNLLNLDGMRTYPTRRVMVDVLKKQQTVEAYNILVEAKDLLAYQRKNLTGTDGALSDDLAARIDAAIHPYFTN
jgi:hypothetical protein